MLHIIVRHRNPMQFLCGLLFLLPVVSWAQRQNVSGVVKGPNGAIADVSVREIDKNHRIFNNTRTDSNGFFSFQVRDGGHSLQFYAPGFRTLSHKMLGAKRFTVTLEPCRVMPQLLSAKTVLNSDRLFCGRHLGAAVRLQAWMEQLSDTLFVLILPVEMNSLVDEYPVGRQLMVFDTKERLVMQCSNVYDAYPIAGDPNEIDEMRLSRSSFDIGYIPGASDEERLFAYPRFLFTRAQLAQLCEEPSLLGRIAADTYNANNYWNFFPTDKTIELISKVLKQ